MGHFIVGLLEKLSKKIKNGKPVGPNDIPIEVWKCLGEEGVS